MGKLTTTITRCRKRIQKYSSVKNSFWLRF